MNPTQISEILPLLKTGRQQELDAPCSRLLPRQSNDAITIADNGQLILNEGAPASADFIRAAVAQLSMSFPYVEPTIYNRLVTVLSELGKSEAWIRYAFRTAERTFKHTYDLNVANILAIEQTIDGLTREEVYAQQCERPNEDVFAEYVKIRVNGKLRYITPEVFESVKGLFEKQVNDKGTVVFVPKQNK